MREEEPQKEIEKERI